MRKPFMAGNWKMHESIPEAVVLTQQISNRYKGSWDAVDIVLCPPSIDLRAVWSVLDFDKSSISVGAQNVHWENEGAFTGELSIPMIKDAGMKFSIVGHSERRSMFAETDEMVNRKVRALLAGGLSPIVCVGESLAIRDAGTSMEYVCAQVEAAFAGLDSSQIPSCIIAYEPIWAIGTGRTATPEQAEEICKGIRARVQHLFGDDAAEQIRILYGGSMKPANVEGLIAMPDIDGGLIGGASLKADDFASLVEACI